MLYSNALLHPSTAPLGYDYESGSNLSNSTNNSTNNKIDPYLRSSHNYSCGTNVCNRTSILNLPKSNKSVSFANQYVSKKIPNLELK